MFCSNCGKEIQDNAKFCFNCGQKVEIHKEIMETKVNEIDNKENLTKEEKNAYSLVWYDIFSYIILPISIINLFVDLLKLKNFLEFNDTRIIILIVSLIIIEGIALGLNILLIRYLRKKYKQTIKILKLKLGLDFILNIIVIFVSNYEEFIKNGDISEILIMSAIFFAWYKINTIYFEKRKNLFIN